MMNPSPTAMTTSHCKTSCQKEILSEQYERGPEQQFSQHGRKPKKPLIDTNTQSTKIQTQAYLSGSNWSARPYKSNYAYANNITDKRPKASYKDTAQHFTST